MSCRLIPLGILCKLALCLCACTPRPDTHAAVKAFERLNPDAKVQKVVKVEDEVAARTFQVTFTRDGGRGATGEAFLVYFTETHEWKISDVSPEKAP